VRFRRALVALSFGFVSVVLAYVALRVAERAFFPEPDPAIVIWSERSRFGWRALLAIYLGGAAVFGGHALASRALDRAASWLFRLVILAAAALALQGTLLP